MRIVIDGCDFTEAIRASGELLRIHGIEIVIENPRGSVRRGTALSGLPFDSVLAAHYGYLRSERYADGGDGEPLDCFLGPNPGSSEVFVIRQVNPYLPGRPFDEHKVMFGYDTVSAAMRDYLASHENDAWGLVDSVSDFTMEDFKRWSP